MRGQDPRAGNTPCAPPTSPLERQIHTDRKALGDVRTVLETAHRSPVLMFW